MGDEYDYYDTGSTYDYADTGGGLLDNIDVGDWSGLAGQFLPVALGGGSSPAGGGYNPNVTPTAGVFPGVVGAAGAAVATLGARLLGMFGRGAGSAVINGVKFSMTSLWPYIRKYGPASVAGALGISLAQLGALALAAPQHPRRRRRGISARDITTSRRVISFNKRLTRQLGGSGGHRHSFGGRRSRRRHAHYFH